MRFRLTRQRLFVLWMIGLILPIQFLGHLDRWEMTVAQVYLLVWLVLPIIAAAVAFPRHVRDGMTEAETAERLRRGQCLHCGYDLRASVERCPECGAATKRAV